MTAAISAVGRLIVKLTATTIYPGGEQQFLFTVAEWPNGLYFLRIRIGEVYFYEKMVVVK